MKRIIYLNVIGLILSFFGVLLLNYLTPKILPLDKVTTTLLSQLIVSILIFLLIKFDNKNNIYSRFSLKVDMKIIFLSVIYTVIGFIIFALTSFLFQNLLGYRLTNSSPIMILGNFPFYIGLFIIHLTTAISEELCFRGYVISRLEYLLDSKALAVINSSILFLIVHIPLWGLISIPIGILGSFWGVIFAKTNNLSLIIIIHFLNNFISYGFFIKT